MSYYNNKYMLQYRNCYLNYYQCYMESALVITNNYTNALNRKRVAAAIMLANRKRKYKKREYWVAPIFNIRDKSGFFKAIFPTLCLEDLRFHNYLRMSATQLERLLQLVGADIYKENLVREPIETAQRLVLTLRYLASGDSIISISYQYLVGYTTTANIIYEVCEAIWKNLQPAVLPNKFTQEKWVDISKQFEDMWDFPHCMGAIDGKHVVIQCPRNAGSSYYNYKGSHSVVLLAVCTASYMCTLVDIGSYGRRSDGGIFQESNFGKRFENNTMNIPPACPVFNDGPVLEYCIVGDEAFPLKSYLLRPYPGKRTTTQEKQVFNLRLSRARRTIENTFGIIASRWRIFRKPILSNPGHVITIIKAVVCLHNWLRMQDLADLELKSFYVTPDMVDREDENGLIEGTWRNLIDNRTALQNIHRMGNNASSRAALEIREKFCNYFNNEGSLGWQYYYL